MRILRRFRPSRGTEIGRGLSMCSKVIVAHPGQQHSYRLASALKHAGLLDEYITTVYYRSPASLLGLMAVLAPGDNGARIRGRNNPDLEPADVKQFYELRGIAETLMYRTSDVSRFRGYMNRTKELFGVAVAKEAIARGAAAVVCYDRNALPVFRYLKQHAPGVKRVLDASNVPRSFRRSFYERVIEQYGDDALRSEERLAWDSSNDKVDAEEIALAEYCLAGSDFVVEGLVSAGAKRECVLKLPYGCNFDVRADEPEQNEGGPLRFLFVGQCVTRKGLRVLADAFEDERLGDCELTVAGKYNPEAEYMQRLLANPRVKVLGTVTHGEVARLCRSSDAFVFPSYNEGMSLACLEAMGSGLAMVVSPNSGVADIVQAGEAGVVVPCGDAGALVAAMNRLIDDRGGCHAMRLRAIETASKFTWAEYERRAGELFRGAILA